ncbi:hypothetical protein L2091_04555, partial [Curtobacterium albidum]|nr:hypothetical protein [Curtobacterium albidum]
AAPTTDAFELSSALNVAVADAPAFTFAFESEPASADASLDESAMAATRDAAPAVPSAADEPRALVFDELSAFAAFSAAPSAATFALELASADVSAAAVVIWLPADFATAIASEFFAASAMEVRSPFAAPIAAPTAAALPFASALYEAVAEADALTFPSTSAAASFDASFDESEMAATRDAAPARPLPTAEPFPFVFDELSAFAAFSAAPSAETFALDFASADVSAAAVVTWLPADFATAIASEFFAASATEERSPFAAATAAPTAAAFPLASALKEAVADAAALTLLIGSPGIGSGGVSVFE